MRSDNTRSLRVDVSPSLFSALRVLAAIQDKSIGQLVRELLTEHTPRTEDVPATIAAKAKC